MNQAGGLYSMNASGAGWYAYCHNEREDEISTGEFVYLSEGVPTIDRFDGYVDLKTKQIKRCKA